MSDADEYVLGDLKQHPRVCSNCFRLRHREDPVPERIQELSRRVLWADSVLPNRTQTRHAETANPPGEVVSERFRTVCECGDFSPFAHVRRSNSDPLTTERAIEYTRHISETLDVLAQEAHEREKGRLERRYSHDTDALFDVVRYLKSKPEYQFRDDHIFSAAVEIATGRAGERQNGT